MSETNSMTIGATMRLSITLLDVPTHPPTEEELASGFKPATTVDAVEEFSAGFLEMLEVELINPLRAEFGNQVRLGADVEVEAFWVEGDEERAAATAVLAPE